VRSGDLHGRRSNVLAGVVESPHSKAFEQQTPGARASAGARRRTHLNTLTRKCRLSNICDVDVYIFRPHEWAAKGRVSPQGVKAQVSRVLVPGGTGVSPAWNEHCWKGRISLVPAHCFLNFIRRLFGSANGSGRTFLLQRTAWNTKDVGDTPVDILCD
jgi:hypothetical protein